MRKIKQCFILILITLNIFLFLTGCKNRESETIKYRYSSGTKDYDGELYYSDDYFKAESTIYNPSLATTSLGLAMASFASQDVADVKDYSFRYKNVSNLMVHLGFSDLYANDDFKKKPTVSSLGAVYANKKIGDYTLIAIGIRGAGYQQEWSSNCKVGDGIAIPHHEGFQEGSDILLNGLKYYINQKSIEGKIKIWSVGFSRASAVNNLTLGRIDLSLHKKESILPSSVSVTKEDIYGYCFEVPMGANQKEEISPRSEIYNNIFNIINVCDPVPMVPMSGLGFTRYGIDIYLPNALNDSNYLNDLNTIKSFYSKQAASKDIGKYVIDQFVYYGGLGERKTDYSGDDDLIHFHGGFFIMDLLNKMMEEGIEDRIAFKNNIQDGLMSAFEMVFQNDTMTESLAPLLISFLISLITTGDIDYLIEEIMHNPDNFVNDLMPIIKNTVEVSTLLVNVSPREFCDQIKGIITVLTKVFNKHLYLLFPFVSINNLMAIAQAHQPIVCMANLCAMDPNYTKKPIECDTYGGYYLLEINYPSAHGYINISMDGIDIARIYEGKVYNLSMYTYGILDDKFIAYLPIGHSYKVTSDMTAYTLKEYNQMNFILKDKDHKVIHDEFTDEITLEF